MCTCTLEHPEKTEQGLIAVQRSNVETRKAAKAQQHSTECDGALAAQPNGAEIKPLWKHNEETWGPRWRISRQADGLNRGGKSSQTLAIWRILLIPASWSGDLKPVKRGRVLYWLLISHRCGCSIHSRWLKIFPERTDAQSDAIGQYACDIVRLETCALKKAFSQKMIVEKEFMLGIRQFLFYCFKDGQHPNSNRERTERYLI